MSASEFTHLDPLGRARMVDVTSKDATHRRAVARCRVFMATDTAAKIASGAVSKGDVLEALTACSVAALTIYDMCKSIDRGMTIGNLALWEKTGGRSGTYRRAEEDDDLLEL